MVFLQRSIILIPEAADLDQCFPLRNGEQRSLFLPCTQDADTKRPCFAVGSGHCGEQRGAAHIIFFAWHIPKDAALQCDRRPFQAPQRPNVKPLAALLFRKGEL